MPQQRSVLIWRLHLGVSMLRTLAGLYLRLSFSLRPCAHCFNADLRGGLLGGAHPWSQAATRPMTVPRSDPFDLLDEYLTQGLCPELM